MAREELAVERIDAIDAPRVVLGPLTAGLNGQLGPRHTPVALRIDGRQLPAFEDRSVVEQPAPEPPAVPHGESARRTHVLDAETDGSPDRVADDHQLRGCARRHDPSA